MRTKIMTLARRHRACDAALRWLATQPKDMSLADMASHRSDWTLWLATRPGVLTDRELRLFAVYCARAALALVTSPDPRSEAACDVAERFSNGQTTSEELAAAFAAAWDAAWDAAGAAAWDAAGPAAGAAARDAAGAAAGSAASDAWAAARDAAFAAAVAGAWDAAGAAAGAAGSAAWDAWDAAGAAVRAAQVQWLLQNTTPNLEAGK